MKFENLYIECENLEQRDEVFNVCLMNGFKRYCGDSGDLGVCVEGGLFFDFSGANTENSTMLNHQQFITKYGKSEMKKSIEKAMADLKMGREELSSALGMSRPYITKMLTCPQSEKTQVRVVKMIDELMQSGGAKNIPIPDSAEKFLLKGIIDARDKTIKELNQALEYKDQLLAKNEDDLHNQTNRVNAYKDDNSKLSLKIYTQQKSIEDKSSELLDCKIENSTLSNQVKYLKRENKDLQIHYAIVYALNRRSWWWIRVI